MAVSSQCQPLSRVREYARTLPHERCEHSARAVCCCEPRSLSPVPTGSLVMRMPSEGSSEQQSSGTREVSCLLCSWPLPVTSLVSDTEDTVCRASEGRKPAQASTSHHHDKM